MKKLLLSCLTGLVCCTAAPNLFGVTPTKAYLFSYFTGKSHDGLHLAYSYDGLKWTPLNNDSSFLRPQVGEDKLMRDPSITQGPDGTFHMVWTSSWTDRIIGYASSPDLIHWSEQQTIPVMMHEPEAKNSWAPELFYDKDSDTFYIFWATTIPGRHSEVAESEREKGLNHRLYYVTTKDFRTYSDTKLFFNPDFSVIDGAIVRDKNNDYVMVLKNENPNPPEKNIRITRTRSLADGFPVEVSAPITGKYWAEGPAPLQVGDYMYVYFDKYREHKYGAVRSTDLIHWEDVSDSISFPKGTRHGTAFTVDKEVLEKLLSPSTAPQARGWFRTDDLILTGSYYYPEHWDRSQWERDFKKMHDMGFEFVHFAEFAWAQLEPEEGKYDFEWLDEAIRLAAKYDLKVILCTSTATPPVWLVRKYPEVLIQQEDGQVLDHGARQHASFASPRYRDLSYKMIQALAARYGKDKRVIGWQLDNEPAVQFDYRPAAEQQFREYLRDCYADNIDALNKAWGTAFWSQVYRSFDEITLPKFRQMFMNHHQILDYRRFAVSQTTDFLDQQARVIRKEAPAQWVTTNYIPNYDEGHIGGSKELDFHSYTRYMVYGDNEGVGKRGYRIGNPIRIPFANDFFRPIQDCYGVMELQPGQVNWGEINPQPLPGAVSLWLWSVFAGGSDFICTYRFRQPLYGTEQYHYGIVGPDGVTVTPGGEEYARFIQDVRHLRQHQGKPKEVPVAYSDRRAAILYNHENAWSISRQKQNKTWDTQAHVEKYYRPLKAMGAPVDIISEEKSFEQYPVLIAPAYQLIDSVLVARWQRYAEQGGHLVLTARTGHKDRHGRLFEAPFRAPLDKLTGNSVTFYDLMLPGDPGKVKLGKNEYSWNTWGEMLEPAAGTQVWASYGDDFYAGKPAVTHRKVGKGSVTYVGVDSNDGQLENAVLRKLYDERNTPVLNLPEGIIVEYRNGFGIVLNYSDQPYRFDIPKGSRVMVGSATVPGCGVLVFTI